MGCHSVVFPSYCPHVPNLQVMLVGIAGQQARKDEVKPLRLFGVRHQDVVDGLP